MFSVITHIYNKKIKGPTLTELFTATGKLKRFFWQLLLNCCSVLFRDLYSTFRYTRNYKLSDILPENNDTVTINKITSAIILHEKRQRLHVNTT
jgi:hypothetical protein